MKSCRVALVQIGDDPDAAQIGDAIELEPAIETETRRNVTRQDESVYRSRQNYLLRQLAGNRQVGDLPLTHAHRKKSIFVQLDLRQAGLELLLGNCARLLQAIERV